MTENTSDVGNEAAAKRISGAYVLAQTGRDFRTRIGDVLGDELTDIWAAWHRRMIGYGRDIIDPSTGKPTSNPYLDDVPAIPVDQDEHLAIAEKLIEAGVSIPTRQQMIDFAEADARDGGDGFDPEIELTRASLLADPDLNTAVPRDEKRINGVPESVYSALPTDAERLKVEAGLVIAPPQAPTYVAHWLIRHVFSRRLLLRLPSDDKGRRRSAWMRTLIRAGQTWYSYESTGESDPPRWVSKTDPEWMRARLRDVLAELLYVKTRQLKSGNEYSLKAWNPDTRTLKMVEDALADKLSADELAHGPFACELSDVYGRTRHVYSGGTRVLVRNGVLDVETGQLSLNTPLWFSLSRIEADYDHAADASAEGTLWMEMLRDQWGDDPGAIECLQQWFGYVLSGDMKRHKALLIIGLGGTGKGNIAAVLKALVSGHTSTDLHRLNTNFGLAKLYKSGATLAVMGDVRFNAADSSQAIENLLGIIGEDTMPIDIKHHDEVDADLKVRFHMSANEIPNLLDHAGAVSRRLLLLHAQNVFGDVVGLDDVDLRSKIIDNELGRVLRWAVAGLEKLNRQGYFTRSKAHDEMMGTLKGMMSPVLMFAQDCVVPGVEDAKVSQDSLYRAWCLWASQNGHKPGPKVRFIEKLTSLPDYPTFKTGHTREDGRIVYGVAQVRSAIEIVQSA